MGALAALAAMAATLNAVLLPDLKRFSALAVPVVGGVVLTGLMLAVGQLARFGALIDSRYGPILSVKLVLVLGLLSPAALNRFWLMPALTTDPTVAKPLVRSTLLEGVVVVGILAVVAGSRFTPPPRALAAAAASSAASSPLTIRIANDKAVFQVLVSPGKVGADNFML